MAKTKNLVKNAVPNLPSDTPRSLRPLLNALRENSQVLGGQGRGNVLDRALTLRDLEAGTVDALLAGAVYRGTGVSPGGSTPPTPSTGIPDPTVPTKPTNFRVAATDIEATILWDSPNEAVGTIGYHYTRVYRTTNAGQGFEEPDVGNDVILLGTANGSFADLNIIGEVTYYYWARHVNTDGVMGPVSDRASGDIPLPLIDETGWVQESHLYSILNSRIDLVDATVTGDGSVGHAGFIAGAEAQYVVKLDVNGYVAGFGLMNDGTTSEFLINADKIAFYNSDPAGDDIVPFQIINNEVHITDAQIINLRVNHLESAYFKDLSPAEQDADPVSTLGNLTVQGSFNVPNGAITSAMISDGFKSSIVRYASDASVFGGNRTISSDSVTGTLYAAIEGGVGSNAPILSGAATSAVSFSALGGVPFADRVGYTLFPPTVEFAMWRRNIAGGPPENLTFTTLGTNTQTITGTSENIITPGEPEYRFSSIDQTITYVSPADFATPTQGDTYEYWVVIHTVGGDWSSTGSLTDGGFLQLYAEEEPSATTGVAVESIIYKGNTWLTANDGNLGGGVTLIGLEGSLWTDNFTHEVVTSDGFVHPEHLRISNPDQIPAIYITGANSTEGEIAVNIIEHLRLGHWDGATNDGFMECIRLSQVDDGEGGHWAFMYSDYQDTYKIALKGASDLDGTSHAGHIKKSRTLDGGLYRDELQIYASGDAYSTNSKGAGTHHYGNRDDQHAGNFVILTGQSGFGDARMIVAGGSELPASDGYRGTTNDTRITIGNDLWNFVDTLQDTGMLNLKDPNGRPAIVFHGVSITEGELAVPDGGSFSIGHWSDTFGSGGTFTERLAVDSAGIVVAQDGIRVNAGHIHLNTDLIGITDASDRVMLSATGAKVYIGEHGAGTTDVSLHCANQPEWYDGSYHTIAVTDKGHNWTASQEAQDNVKWNVGNGADGSFWHNGVGTYLDNKTGNFNIRNTVYALDMYLRGENSVGASHAGLGVISNSLGVFGRIYHEGDGKAEAVSDGFDVTAPYFYVNGRRAFRSNDTSWLRIADDSDFSEGVYFATNIIRTDHEIHIGGDGDEFFAGDNVIMVGGLAKLSTDFTTSQIETALDKTALDVFSNTSTGGRNVLSVWSNVGGPRTLAYAIEADGTIQTSDETLKRDIEPLESQWDAVDDFEFLSYRWKNCFKEDGSLCDKTVGLGAQRTLGTLNDDVVKHPSNGNEHFGIRYDAVNIKTHKAQQEAQSRIKALEHSVTLLTGAINVLIMASNA